MKDFIKILIHECLNENQTVEDYKDKTIDYLIEKYGLNKNIVYHGTNDVTYFKNVGDVNTLNNTKNAKSKYLFVNNKPSVAINYAKDYNGFGKNSGIIVFKLTGKSYVMKKNDIPIAFKSMVDFELFLDSKKELGYDFVKIPQDGNNIAVLNTNNLILKEVFRIINNV